MDSALENQNRTPSGHLARFGHALCARRAHILPGLLLGLGVVLYQYRAFEYLLPDDEGSYAYAAWRISLGEVPYRDFLTPQMPLFLYWGGLLVRLFGRSFVPLRVGTAAVTLVAAWLLYATNREVLGRRAAILSLGLFLIQPNIFRGARTYLPEAYMLVFELAGLYALVLGEKRQRLWYTALASLFFGLSVLSKSFGALPLAGCFLYLLYAWHRERRPLKVVLWQGLALGLPAVLLVGVVGLVFMRITPYFFTAVFEHHTMQGAGMPLVERARRALILYRTYLAGQPLAVLLAAVGVGLALKQRKTLPALLVWQLPTALVFVVLSRDLVPRHLTYLAPVLVTSVGLAIAELLKACRVLMDRAKAWWLGAGAGGFAIVLALAAVAIHPWLVSDAGEVAQEESDSAVFVALIDSQSSSDEQVLCDYPVLNFLSGRRATYWAAGLSGGAARSGQIRGANLIDDIEQGDVAMVVLRVSGFDPHMANMLDYDSFRRYLQSRFTFVGTRRWTHTPKEFEIYVRTDTMLLKPTLTYGDDLALDGLRLEDEEATAGSSLKLEWRWRVLRPTARDYLASVCLVDAVGRQWAEAHTQLVDPYDGTARTSTWRAGESLWLKQELPLSQAMPAGSYHLVVQAYSDGSDFVPAGREWDGPTAGGVPALATVRVLPPAEAVPPASAGEPEIRYPTTDVRFGEYFGLLGYDLSTTELRPGEKVTVTLYWTYRRPSAVDYTVFIHLLDRGSQIQGQADLRPQGGGRLTSGWVMGDVLVDCFEVPLKADAARGTLRVALGFYDQATGARLPIVRGEQITGEDSLLLPTTIAVR